MTWHFDLSMAELARTDKIKAFGCVPTLANHSGRLRISSYSYNQIGTVDLKTDTH
jgi:hypothetical protein